MISRGPWWKHWKARQFCLLEPFLRTSHSRSSRRPEGSRQHRSGGAHHSGVAGRAPIRLFPLSGGTSLGGQWHLGLSVVRKTDRQRRCAVYRCDPERMEGARRGPGSSACQRWQARRPTSCGATTDTRRSHELCLGCGHHPGRTASPLRLERQDRENVGRRERQLLGDIHGSRGFRVLRWLIVRRQASRGGSRRWSHQDLGFGNRHYFHRVQSWLSRCEVAWGPNPNQLASGGTDGCVRMWRLPDAALRQSFTAHSKQILKIVILDDGDRLISVSADRTARICRASTGECVRVFEGHTGEVNSVAVAADKRHMISASEDCTLKVWDVESGSCLATLRGHCQTVWRVAVSPDCKLVASGAADNTVRLWDLASKQCIQELPHPDCVAAVAFSPEGSSLAVGCDDSRVYIYSIEFRPDDGKAG